MRKLLLGAVALLGLSAVNANQAQACSSGTACVSELGTNGVGDSLVVGLLLGTIVYEWLDNVIVGAVIRDIRAGGLNRKYAEVTPGSGYQARDLATAATLTHEFNVAMGYADDAQTTHYLASVGR